MLPILSAVCGLVLPNVLTVGDGKQFSRIEEAVGAAHAGDTIQVFSSQVGYAKTAVLVRTPGLTIIGMGIVANGMAKKITIDGQGYEYSGSGSVPRAIFQIDPGADGVTIEGFELCGAHNQSHNGAGIRVNQAKQATVSGCDIHGNDMGIMSNGAPGDSQSASDQLYDACAIHENGDTSDPGYNHNLYLGGTSATLRDCEVWGALTGHNVKTRAHFTLLERCYIHDSANREVDCVDAWDTTLPNSNAAIVDCVIAKNPNCQGNRNVINFGAEAGQHTGRLWLVNVTVLTPFLSPVVQLTATSSSVVFTDTIVVNTHQAHPVLVGASNGALLSSAAGNANWFSTGYDLAGTSIDSDSRYSGTGQHDDLGIRAPFFVPRTDPAWHPVAGSYVDGDGITRLAGRLALGSVGRPRKPE